MPAQRCPPRFFFDRLLLCVRALERLFDLTVKCFRDVRLFDFRLDFLYLLTIIYFNEKKLYIFLYNSIIFYENLKNKTHNNCLNITTQL